MATQAELEAAVAAFQAKKRRLREAFGRLVACSPVPVPFRWEDLDAHLASVAARFGCHHFDTIHAPDAAAAATARGDPATTGYHVEPLEKEEDLQQDRARRCERGDWEEQHDSSAEEAAQAEHASLELEHGQDEGKVREASSLRPDREGDRTVNESEAIEACPNPQHDDGEKKADMEAIMASRRQGDDDMKMVIEAEEAVNASAGQEGREDEAEEGECPHPGTHAAAVGGEKTLTTAIGAACASMDASALVDLLCLSSRSSLRARRAFLPALLGAADPHALLVRAVGGFLASAGRGRSKCWGNCVALIECVPSLAAPSAEALAQAERLAGHWKEMVLAKPASCGDMDQMAGWGLLTFLASYSIAPPFYADEIIRLFGNIAPHKKNNCIDLCKRLGLFEKMNDSINQFIEDGQPLDAIKLAHTFNLTDKYPPLTIMTDYVENAKKTVEDILSKESYSLESLNQAMAKKIDALIFSWSAIDGCNIDPVHRNAIKAEITRPLHKYANKQQSLAGISAATSSLYQQHNFQEQYEQQAQMQLVEQQQQKPDEEQQHQQQMPQEVEHQHNQNQQEPQEREKGWVPQNRRGKRHNNKNRKRRQHRQKQQQLNKRPSLFPYVRPGIHNQRCTRTWYFSPYDYSQPHLPVFHR